MRIKQAEQFNAKLEREVRHMFNGGARRDTVILYVAARIITADASFTSRQLRQIFEMVL